MRRAVSLLLAVLAMLVPVASAIAAPMRDAARVELGAENRVKAILPSGVVEAEGHTLFLQRDPNGYEDSVNQYAYGANDPINHRDPTGAMLQVPRHFTLEQRLMGVLRGAINFAGRVGGTFSSLNPWGPTLDEVDEQMDRDFAQATEEYGDSVDSGLQLSMALIPGPKGSRAAEATGRGNIIRVRPGEAPVRLTPRVPEPPPATMGEPGPKATLELARRIADVERPPMNNKRTVSVLETHEGPTVVGGGKTDLSPAQVKLAEELGLVVAPPRPTRHAEPTAILGAKELGYTPKRGVTTNIICAGSADSCAIFIESEGGTVTGKRTYEFPGR